MEVLCEFDTSIANSFVSTFSKGVSLSILSIAKTDELFTFHLLLVTKQKFELWSNLHHLAKDSAFMTERGSSSEASGANCTTSKVFRHFENILTSGRYVRRPLVGISFSFL